jgi:hypothetical protein
VEDIVEQTCLEASVEIAADVVVGSVVGIAAELDVKVFGVVDFAVVEVMMEVVCISEWVYAHSRLEGSLGPACNPAGPDAAEVELWSSAEVEELQSHFLVTAVVTAELVRVVEVARVGHHYGSGLV